MQSILNKLPNRDHIVWTLGLLGSIAAYVGAHAGVFGPEHAKQIEDDAALVAAVSGKLGTSPLFDRSVNMPLRDYICAGCHKEQERFYTAEREPICDVCEGPLLMLQRSDEGAK